MAVDGTSLKFSFGANHVCLIWFCRKNFDKILEKLKDKHSDKRFISTDGKHFSTKLTVSPPNLSSLSEIVCEKPIPFISMKTDVETQAVLWGSDNRDIKSFIEQNTQLTSFPSKIEEDRSINMEMKLPETVAQENLENLDCDVQLTKNVSMCVSPSGSYVWHHGQLPKEKQREGMVPPTPTPTLTDFVFPENNSTMKSLLGM
ncbi:hypothetical protein GQX74_015665 [Glossina fuscipes]|nr:hypothetical protein GQX74_015665 [Glossina fuscipes]